MQLLDGKGLADRILTRLQARLANLRTSRRPRGAFLRVGNDTSSIIYVRRKTLVANRIGMEIEEEVLPADASEGRILDQIERWNADPRIDGILVQLPLPNTHFHRSVFEIISPDKDIDGFHPINFGRLAKEIPGGFIPCTPKGILRLLETYQIPLEGRHVVIIGRSLIVGRPLSLLLQSLQISATVTLCHSKTRNLADLTRSADLVICAAGHPNLLGPSMVRDGVVVVDVGINRFLDPSSSRGHRICGDVDFPAIAEKCSFITPVPGGVGPMTIAMLMENLLEAFERRELGAA